MPPDPYPKERLLTSHLAALLLPTTSEMDHPLVFNTCSRLAAKINQDRQGLVDVLVKVGILKEQGAWVDHVYEKTHALYRVVESPHDHSWFVVDVVQSKVRIECSCGQYRWADEHLPIEIPDIG